MMMMMIMMMMMLRMLIESLAEKSDRRDHRWVKKRQYAPRGE